MDGTVGTVGGTGVIVTAGTEQQQLGSAGSMRVSRKALSACDIPAHAYAWVLFGCRCMAVSVCACLAGSCCGIHLSRHCYKVVVSLVLLLSTEHCINNMRRL
jgi:hypothetical protein